MEPRRRRCVPRLSARGEHRGAGLRAGHLELGIDRMSGLQLQVRCAPGDSSLETSRPSRDPAGPPRRWEHRLGGRRHQRFEACRKLLGDAISQELAMHHVLSVDTLCARRSLTPSSVVQHPHVFPSGWSPRLGGHTETRWQVGFRRRALSDERCGGRRSQLKRWQHAGQPASCRSCPTDRILGRDRRYPSPSSRVAPSAPFGARVCSPGGDTETTGQPVAQTGASACCWQGAVPVETPAWWARRPVDDRHRATYPASEACGVRALTFIVCRASLGTRGGPWLLVTLCLHLVIRSSRLSVKKCRTATGAGDIAARGVAPQVVTPAG